ncbi:transcriptional regulator [Candidatus Poribacteria bacterium]|nr:MAG: transcriptional regulator [Candidatus Poribacteria bacterium]
MRKYRKWRDIVIEQLAANWDEALDYIQFAMEEYQTDGDTEVFLLALYTFVESQGGVAEIAKRTHMDPQTLTEVLSSEDAPRIDTLVIILTALGCRLSIEPLKAESCGAARADVDTSVTPIKGTKPEIALATDNK